MGTRDEFLKKKHDMCVGHVFRTRFGQDMAP